MAKPFVVDVQDGVAQQGSTSKFGKMLTKYLKGRKAERQGVTSLDDRALENIIGGNVSDLMVDGGGGTLSCCRDTATECTCDWDD